MANTFSIDATKRELLGKGASRRLRREQSLVLGIVYGAGKTPQPITIPLNIMTKALENEAFYSQILTLNLEGTEESVVLKDLQRHPATSTVMHADFQRIDATKKLHMNVPLHFINEGKCVGAKTQGGHITHHTAYIEVLCLPKDLPEFIAVDLENLEIGSTLHLSDIDLGEGVESVALSHGLDHDEAVVSVQKPGGGAAVEEDAEVATDGDDEA